MRTASPRCVDFHSLHPMAILYNTKARDLLPVSRTAGWVECMIYGIIPVTFRRRRKVTPASSRRHVRPPKISRHRPQPETVQARLRSQTPLSVAPNPYAFGDTLRLNAYYTISSARQIQGQRSASACLSSSLQSRARFRPESVAASGSQIWKSSALQQRNSPSWIEKLTTWPPCCLSASTK